MLVKTTLYIPGTIFINININYVCMTPRVMLVCSHSVTKMRHTSGIAFALQFHLFTHLHIQEEIYPLKILISLRNSFFVSDHFTTHFNIKVHVMIGVVNFCPHISFGKNLQTVSTDHSNEVCAKTVVNVILSVH